MSDLCLTRNEQFLQDQITALQNRRYPAGFYALGVELGDTPVIQRWSEHSLVMLATGEERVFSLTPRNISKCFSVHSWGLCRLLKVCVGNTIYKPIDGALFLNIDRVIELGFIFEVHIQALDFEPISEMKT